MESIPSPRSFFLDFRLLLLFSSSLKAAAACCSLAMNFSMSSKHLFRMLTSFSYLSLEVELVSSNFSLGSSWACIRGETWLPSYPSLLSLGDIWGDLSGAALTTTCHHIITVNRSTQLAVHTAYCIFLQEIPPKVNQSFPKTQVKILPPLSSNK